MKRKQIITEKGNKFGKVIPLPAHPTGKAGITPPTITLETEHLLCLESQIDGLRFTLDRINDLKYTIDVLLFSSGVRSQMPLREKGE